MEVEASHLKTMGLNPKRATLDEHLGFSKWTKKKELHRRVKAQTGTADKPDAEVWFRHEKGTTCSSAVRCNVCIYIIKVQATVKKGGEDDADKDIPAEYYLCKEETGAWAVENLVTSSGAHKDATHLRHAADPKTYSIPNYFEYIPSAMITASKKYIQLFVTKHKTANEKLTDSMCTFAFTSFKCDLDMDEDGAIEEHYIEVHGIPGVPAMKPLQLIEVDARQDFNLPDLTDLEILGPQKQEDKIDSIYVRGVARGMLTKSYNKESADLVASKSQDFLLEMSKRTVLNFYKRFVMNLSKEVGRDIVSTDFTCKWAKIEKALKTAMSAEQSTVRYSKFLETNHTAFHSLPMDLIIDEVEKYINTALGTSNREYNLRKKYDLIFDIARHLGNDFKIIREYIMQKCTKFHDEIEERTDISAFQEHLAQIFETKGVLLQYKHDDIPAQKKQQIAVNEAKVKKEKNKNNDRFDNYETVEETPEIRKAYQADVKKYSSDVTEDNNLAAEITKMALEISKDRANDDKLVMKNDKIQAFLKSKKKRVCYKCKRQNCLTRQSCSKRHKLPKRFVGNCNGKAVTFKELREQEEKATPPKIVGATAKIDLPAFSDSDSEGEAFSAILNTMRQNNSADFGFNYANQVAEFSTIGVVLEENLPNYEAMKETEFFQDKSCCVCPEEDMDLAELIDHYIACHNIRIKKENALEIFQQAADEYIQEVECEKIRAEKRAAKNSSSSEEQEGYGTSELEEFYGSLDQELKSDSSSSIKSSKSRLNAPKTGSSSDSSSSTNSSRSTGKGKSKTKSSRDIESIRTQMISQKNCYEDKLTNMGKEMDSSYRTIIDNQNKGFEKIDNSLAEDKAFQKEISDKQNICLTKLVENDSQNAKNIKAIENTLVANAAKLKEKEEIEKNKEKRTKEYLITLERRFSKMENDLLKAKEGHKHVEIPLTPKQYESEVIEDSITVQKTQLNGTHASVKPQLKEIAKPSTSQVSSSLKEEVNPTPDALEKENSVESSKKKISGKTFKVNQLKNRGTMLKLRRNRKNIPEAKKEQVPQNFLSLLFTFSLNFTNQMFSLLRIIFSNPTSAVWGVIILLMLVAAKSKAENTNVSSVMQQSPVDLFLSSPNSGYLVYGIDAFETHTLVTPIEELEGNEVEIINDACTTFPILHENCKNHPASCQSTSFSLANLEETLAQCSHSIHTLQRICEPESNPSSKKIISRCNQGLHWDEKKNATDAFKFISGMFDGFTSEYLEHELYGNAYLEQEMSEKTGSRTKRFFISTPILIGTLIGAASLTTAGITAAAVANREVEGVIKAEKLHRVEDISNNIYNDKQVLNLTAVAAKDIDNIRNTEALSSYAAKLRSDAKKSNNELNFLLSKSGSFEYADPRTEQISSIIENSNGKYAVGLTREELREKIKLSTELTSMHTSAISIIENSQKCKDMVLIRTVLTPIINHRSRMEMNLINGRFIPRYGNQSFYVIMSQSSLLSKSQRMFGKNINVVGRSCKVHKSINASTIESNDPLFEIFEFDFEGNLTFSETCHPKGAPLTINKTIFSYAKIKLPLTCSIHSEKINCNSVKFNSNRPEEIHILKHRMEVLEEHFEEKKININSTEFVKSNLIAEIPPALATPLFEKIKWPLIISLAAVTGIIFLSLIGTCLVKRNKSPAAGNNITITNKSSSTVVTPSCPPAEPIISKRAPPSYNTQADIKDLLAIPYFERDATVQRRLQEHYDSTLKSETQE